MRTPRTRARTAAIASLVAMIAALTVVAASADEHEEDSPRVYSLSASPSVLSPDTPTTVTFTISNLTAPQPISLGSANIYIPAGVTVAGESGTIALRNLGIGAGSSASFSFTVSAPCSASLYGWGAAAKQANDFNGEGNNFALAGGLPATSVPCPGGDTTTTTVAGPGEPTTTTTTTTTTLAPVAQFTPRPYYTTTWDVIEPCVGWSCETEPLKLGNTIGKLYGDKSANVLFLSLRPSDEVPDYCGYDFHPKSETVIFDVWGIAAEKIIEITVLGIGEDGDFESEDYEVCFGGEEPFTQKDDRGPAVFGDGLWFGLLPNCGDEDGEGWPGPEYSFWYDEFALGGGTYGPAPCVAWRDLDDTTGDLTVIVLAPPGDPRIKIG